MDRNNRNILVATNHLDMLGGSETFTYALIEELRCRKDVEVEYFTFRKGKVSEKIEGELKVSFSRKEKYDLILANHNTTVNLLSHKGFTIQTCHGIFPELEQPSELADAYVSISQEVQDHLAHQGRSSKIILNGINLQRFKPRKLIRNNLGTVLSLCHSEDINDFIEECCADLQIEFMKCNKYSDSVWDVENLINQADLVIGLGRSAYEAMACGRPVIVLDNRKYFDSVGDGYVQNLLGFSIQNNCSGRYSKKKFDKKDFITELKKYNSSDSVFFRTFAEKELDIRKKVNLYFQYWEDLIKIKKQNDSEKSPHVNRLFKSWFR